MKFPVTLAAGVLAFALGACDVKWGLPDDAQDQDERDEIAVRLQGAWATRCFLGAGQQGEAWVKERYEFTEDAVTWTTREYPDSTCIEADVVLDYLGSFDVGPEVIAADGQTVREIDFTYDDIVEVEGEADLPGTPYERFDILLLKDDDTGFFLGRKDEIRDGEDPAARPVAVDFDVEYEKEQ